MIEIDKTSITTTLKNLKGYQTRALTGLQLVSEAAALAMQTYAQTNAKWTDRTGNARQRLQGSSYWNGRALVTAVQHHVDYGVWLELAHGRKYAILEEALASEADELLKQYKKIVGDS
jgi:hypothetical protein